MGRLSFKRKSKSLSPAERSPRELTGSPSSVPAQGIDDASLAANPNASSTSGAVQGATGSQSYSTPAKAISRSGSLGRGANANNAESGMFAEQLQRLRARLHSVVQGVREVAQSLDEPHSLIANVRDQLQTRQDAAAARRNGAALAGNAPERDTTTSAPGGMITTGVYDGSAGLVSAAPPSLSRNSTGSKIGGASRRGNFVSTAVMTEATPYGYFGNDGSGLPGVAASISPDVDPADGGSRSVKARVAEVERRSRSSGGLPDLLPVLVAQVVMTAEGPLSRTSMTQTQLVAAHSFSSGSGGGVATAAEPTDADSPPFGSQGGSQPSDKVTPSASRANSGTWRPVMIPAVAPGPSAGIRASDAKSHPVVIDGAGSRNVSGGGAVDMAAALAAADSVTADAAELLGSGDDSLLAATANPAVAVAYLREHPETLRELWSLRARVRTQESELASMVMQLSTKNAQLDQVQTTLQVKERELGTITHRLTGVLAKLQSFQAAHSHELPHQDPLQRGAVGGAGGAADAVHCASRAPATPMTSTPLTAPAAPDAVVSAAIGMSAAPNASCSVLPASSTPQTPLRSAPTASSSLVPALTASHFAAAKAALQAEAEAAAIAAAGPSRAPRNTASACASFAASTSASAEASITNSAAASPNPSPRDERGLSPTTLEVSLPPPPSVRMPFGSASQVLEEAAQVEPDKEVAEEREGGDNGFVIEAATPAAAASSSLQSPAGVTAAAPLDMRPEPAIDMITVAASTRGDSDGAAPSVADEPATSSVRSEVAAIKDPLVDPEVLHEMSAMREMLRMQESQLALMMEHLSAKGAQLDQALVALEDKEQQLGEAQQLLDSALAQLRSIQQAPQPQPQPPRPRFRGGLLRTLLLQVMPWLACVGLLLRDEAVLKRLRQMPLRQLRRFRLRSSTPGEQEPTGPSLRSLPVSPSQHEHVQQHSPRPEAPPLEALPLDNKQRRIVKENLRRRVIKIVTTAAAALRVRPPGKRRSWSASVMQVHVPVSALLPKPAAPLAVEENSRTPWSSECKSHWCKIIRPPPREAVYY